MPSFERAADGVIAVARAVMNGLMRAGRTDSVILVMPDGNSTRSPWSRYHAVPEDSA